MGSYNIRPKKFRTFRYNRTKRWCENHPQSVWGDGYKQCAEGFRTGEPCKEGNETSTD